MRKINTNIYTSVHILGSFPDCVTPPGNENTYIHIQCLSYADSFYDVEATQCCGDEDSRQLRVPVKFLDLRLALVDEQQLWRDIHSLSSSASSILILLHSQVPLNNLEVAMTT